jgi:cell division protein FtsB
VDYDASGRQVNKREPAKKPTSEPSVGFFEQLGQFFRRNMYLFLIIGFALLLLQDVFGTHGVLAMRQSQKEAAEIGKDIKRLDDENQRMQARVKGLKSDLATIEKIAREEMRLSRPGEVIFQTQPKPASDLEGPVPQPGSPAKKP